MPDTYVLIHYKEGRTFPWSAAWIEDRDGPRSMQGSNFEDLADNVAAAVQVRYPDAVIHYEYTHPAREWFRENERDPCETDPKLRSALEEHTARYLASQVILDQEEQAVMDAILAAMEGIKAMGLIANEGELAHHVHGLQGFVIQHMLQRLSPEKWGTWYEPGLEERPRIALPGCHPGCLKPGGDIIHDHDCVQVNYEHPWAAAIRVLDYSDEASHNTYSVFQNNQRLIMLAVRHGMDYSDTGVREAIVEAVVEAMGRDRYT
jgi:hypothetical protein